MPYDTSKLRSQCCNAPIEEQGSLHTPCYIICTKCKKSTVSISPDNKVEKRECCRLCKPNSLEKKAGLDNCRQTLCGCHSEPVVEKCPLDCKCSEKHCPTCTCSPTPDNKEECRCKLIQDIYGKWRTEYAPCHSPQKNTNGWESQFDKEMADFPVNTDYLYFEGIAGERVPSARLAKVKQVIRGLLLSQKERMIENFETALKYNVDEETFTRIMNALSAIKEE